MYQSNLPAKSGHNQKQHLLQMIQNLIQKYEPDKPKTDLKD